jgi:hypothetical protein
VLVRGVRRRGGRPLDDASEEPELVQVHGRRGSAPRMSEAMEITAGTIVVERGLQRVDERIDTARLPSPGASEAAPSVLALQFVVGAPTISEGRRPTGGSGRTFGALNGPGCGGVTAP